MICDRLFSPKRIDCKSNNTTQKPANGAANRTSWNLSFGDYVENNENYGANDGTAN
jgi:hypothetical protein